MKYDIELNKLGREDVDYSDLFALYSKECESKFNSTNAAKPNPCKFYEERKMVASIAAFCPHCDTELSGYWYVNKPIIMQGIPGKFVRDEIVRTCEGCMWDPAFLCDKVSAALEEEYKKRSEPIKREIYEMANLTHCPICENKLEPGLYYVYCKDDYFRPTHPNRHTIREDRISDMRSDMDQRSEYQSATKGKKELKEVISKYDVPIENKLDSSVVESISATPHSLKEYLHHLIELEMGIYSLGERLEALYDKRTKAFVSPKEKKYAVKVEAYNRAFELELEYNACLAKLNACEKGDIGVPAPIKPIPPLFAVASVFNKKKVKAENEALQAKYQESLMAYEEELQAYEEKKNDLISTTTAKAEQLEKELETAKETWEYLQSVETIVTISFEKQLFDDEIKEAEDTLKKLYECRNGLYACDVVFGKYRNVVALSTFYEYLMAGRCTTLEGYEGAYNIYESELHANTIIGQLHRVVEKLDDLKESQYMICSELQTVNSNLNQLNDTMDNALVSIRRLGDSMETMIENTAVIAHNTAVSAYYSKLNAQLTNALGFMMALK